MALVPIDPGRSGPYWRRQQGTTLPGERTGAQLALLNAQRARLGLPPLGGPGGGVSAIPAGEIPGLGSPQPRSADPVQALPTPQLIALRAMLAKAAGQQPRQAQPAAQPGILPQLQHRVVQVRPHTRIVAPRPALSAANLPSY
jgi:hypothetical protein